MNPFESFIVELLQGHIHIDEDTVEVRREFLPRAHIPCITLDIVTDNNTCYRRTYPEGHENLEFEHDCDINIHVWCNSEREREDINSQIRDCYTKSLNHHYRYCGNYDDGNCINRNSLCTGFNSYKKKCPKPYDYEYQCLSDKYGLEYGTIDFESPIHSDEYDQNPPILHSIWRCHAGYVEVVSSTGEPVLDYSYGSITVEDTIL